MGCPSPRAQNPAPSTTITPRQPPHQTAHPPPKAHNRAPSTTITPANHPARQPIPHRRRNPVHPRPRLPRPMTPPDGLSPTEGAILCTLNHDYPRQPPHQTAHPPPKAHNRAPSTTIRSRAARFERGNGCRGSTIVHPRPGLGRESAASGEVTSTEGAIPCTLGAAHRATRTAPGHPRHAPRAPLTKRATEARRCARGCGRRRRPQQRPRRSRRCGRGSRSCRCSRCRGPRRR